MRVEYGGDSIWTRMGEGPLIEVFPFDDNIVVHAVALQPRVKQTMCTPASTLRFLVVFYPETFASHRDIYSCPHFDVEMEYGIWVYPALLTIKTERLSQCLRICGLESSSRLKDLSLYEPYKLQEKKLRFLTLGPASRQLEITTQQFGELDLSDDGPDPENVPNATEVAPQSQSNTQKAKSLPKCQCNRRRWHSHVREPTGSPCARRFKIKSEHVQSKRERHP